MRTLRSLLGRGTVAALLAGALLVPASAAAAAPIIQHGFEDGTTQGWGPRGPVTLSVSAEAAHGGQAGLLTTGRTANWNGPSLNLLGRLDQGTTYTVTAHVRLVAGQPGSTIAVTMQRTPTGGSTVFERIAAGTATDGGWTELTGDYVFTADSSELQLYVESSDPTGQYYLDDFSITAVDLGGDLTTDFEAGGAQGWFPRINAETLTVTAADAHGGSRSLLTTGRTQTYAGPALNLLGRLEKGSRYALSAWVKLAPGESPAQLRMSIERRWQGTPSFETVAGDTRVTDGQWVELKGTYLLANDVDFLAVYVESASGTPSFHLDDFAKTLVPEPPIQTDIPALKDELPFDVGAAVNPPKAFGSHAELWKKHFDSATPDNALKWSETEPQEGTFTFANSDAIVNFAKANGIKVRGHTLVWHSQVPDWLFRDAAGNPLTPTAENKALLLGRLENHIRAVAGRYADDIYAWDVVNEVVDESQPDGLRRSPWYEITGTDYIDTAFRVAREVAPNAKLYINDFNTEFAGRRQALYNLVKQLKARGVPVDGVGHQLHVNIEKPIAAEIEKTIELFAGLGLDQQITELDVSAYPNFADSYATVPPEVLVEQGYRYKEIFDVFERQADRLSSVTLWGLADDDTWLSTFPITRTNPALLFDDRLQAKPAYWAVVDPPRLAPLTRTLSASRGSPKIDGKADPVWELQPAATIARVGNLSAAFRLRWDSSRLYVIADVRDPSAGKNDSVEVTVDGKTYKITQPRGFPASTTKLPGGYRVEAAIPLTGAVGRTLDFDLRVRDAAGASVAYSAGTPARVTLAPAVKVAEPGKGTPVIDGTVDAAWFHAPEITTGTWVQGTAGATAKVRTLWDAGRLYVLARVADPVLSDASLNPHEQDSVEIFVDTDNAKWRGYDDVDGQYRINFKGVETINSNFDAIGIQGNLTSKAVIIRGGYLIEASIKLPSPAAPGTLLGFDVQVNDDGTGDGTRTSAVTWNDPSGRSHVSTAGFGVLRLMTKPAKHAAR